MLRLSRLVYASQGCASLNLNHAHALCYAFLLSLVSSSISLIAVCSVDSDICECAYRLEEHCGVVNVRIALDLIMKKDPARDGG